MPHGKVIGRVLPSGTIAYENIPFAKPPVKELRFRAPQPLAPTNNASAVLNERHSAGKIFCAQGRVSDTAFTGEVCSRFARERTPEYLCRKIACTWTFTCRRALFRPFP